MHLIGDSLVGTAGFFHFTALKLFVARGSTFSQCETIVVGIEQGFSLVKTSPVEATFVEITFIQIGLIEVALVEDWVVDALFVMSVGISLGDLIGVGSSCVEIGSKRLHLIEGSCLTTIRHVANNHTEDADRETEKAASQQVDSIASTKRYDEPKKAHTALKSTTLRKKRHCSQVRLLIGVSSGIIFLIDGI